MEKILSCAVIIAQLSIAIFLFMRTEKGKKKEVKPEIFIVRPQTLLGLSSFMIMCNLISGIGTSVVLCADIMLSLVAMIVICTSLCPQQYLLRLLTSVALLEILMSVYYILCSFKVLSLPDDRCILAFCSVISLYLMFYFFWTIWFRVRDVKAVMRSGTVWSFLGVCVDLVYVLVPSAVLLLLHIAVLWSPSTLRLMATVASVPLILELIALGVRIVRDSIFVLHPKHENIIVESMKISQMEMVNSNPKADEMYRDIYERIVLYFEISKPFLNGELTINDIVKVVYSNKVYISKAISHYTGRNFRQFVNYHRVMYSMDLFRSNPLLKVSELAEKCGFNSVVSYTMAFRLFMNETPSDWTRKEKTKLIKTKK